MRTFARTSLNYIGNSERVLTIVFPKLSRWLKEKLRMASLVEQRIDHLSGIHSCKTDRVTGHSNKLITPVFISVHRVAIGQQDVWSKLSLESQITFDTRRQASNIT